MKERYPKEMDKRISYKLIIDTETCPIDKDFEGVSPENMWAYDIGFAVVDKRGTVYETRSYINSQIFIEERELMKSAYYADKIPKYWEDIKNGTRKLATLYNIRQEMLRLIKEYDIKEVYAHNMRFDYGNLNVTQRWLTKSKYRYFFPKDIKICDTLKMANDVIGKMPSYRRFCEENGFMTSHKTPRPQMKAETIYRFITDNPEFVESHTGLEDVLIEKEILAYCYKQHKKMRKGLWD